MARKLGEHNNKYINNNVSMLFVCMICIGGLFTSSLANPVKSTSLGDQKNYYYSPPDPHAGTPPQRGSHGHGHGHSNPTSPPHGHGGAPPTHSTPSNPTPSTPVGNCNSPPHSPTPSTPTPSTPRGGYYNPPPSSPGGSPPTYGGGSPPTYGGGGGSPPTYGGGSPPTPVTVPTPSTPTTPPTDPGSGTPTTPTVPAPPIFPVNPFPGTCNFWKNQPTVVWQLFGWWVPLGTAFGVPSNFRAPGITNMNLLQALSNQRTDGLGALSREGTAALLNSMVHARFPFTTAQVRQNFVAALGSNHAAITQAQVFRNANEGRLKPKA